jgi:hypothetical protein
LAKINPLKTDIGIALLKNKAIGDDKGEQRSNILLFELLNECHHAQLFIRQRI